MSDAVTLQIGNELHRGWEEVEIRRSLEQVADTFELVLTERWGNSDTRPIRPGKECEIYIGDDLVITGFLDAVLPDYDAESHRIIASGRSRTADLVDCSLPEDTVNDQTVLQIARRLAGEFDVEVVTEAAVGDPLRVFSWEDGQPVAEALERAAQIRGLRLFSDERGRLVIGNAERRDVEPRLALGENILRASGRFTDRERFNEYVVEGQSPGDDDWFGEPASSPVGRATDPRVRSTRRTVILADTPVDGKDCKQRAELEARIRWARGRGVTYTVNGWRHDAGIWRPGDVVRVRDAYLGLDERLLVSDAQLLLDDQGMRSELRVSPPEAYEPVPVPEPEEEDLGWGL